MKKLKALIAALTLIATGTTAADIPSTPVTASSDAAKNLYAYFLDQYGKKTISSVMANVNWNNSCAEKVYKLTGKYPAMNCYDFIHICFSPANWIDYTDITPVKDWNDAGGIVQLMWHFNVPNKEGETHVTCTPGDGNAVKDAYGNETYTTLYRPSNVFTEGSWGTRSLPPSSSYRTLALPLPGDLSMRQQAMLAPSNRPIGPRPGFGGALTVPTLTRSCGRPCSTTSSRKASITSSGCGRHRTITVTAANTTRTPTGILATSTLTSWVVTSMATMQHRTCKSSTR